MTVKEREPQSQEKKYLDYCPVKLKLLELISAIYITVIGKNDCLPLLRQSMKLSSVG